LWNSGQQVEETTDVEAKAELVLAESGTKALQIVDGAKQVAAETKETAQNEATKIHKSAKAKGDANLAEANKHA
jgi:F0F1-type ATP synthase membrane subunit b/b'